MLYYYDKYNSVEETVYGSPSSFAYESTATGVAGTRATSWGHSTSTGYYESGTQETISISNPVLFRRISDVKLREYVYINSSQVDLYSSTCSSSTNDTQGSLLTNNIVAEDGTYPNNGKHTDGFWYVRREVVSNGMLALI